MDAHLIEAFDWYSRLFSNFRVLGTAIFGACLFILARQHGIILDKEFHAPHSRWGTIFLVLSLMSACILVLLDFATSNLILTFHMEVLDPERIPNGSCGHGDVVESLHHYNSCLRGNLQNFAIIGSIAALFSSLMVVFWLITRLYGDGKDGQP